MTGKSGPAYFQPNTLQEALAIRAGIPVTVLAGGTDVIPARTARAGWGDMRQPDVLDVSRLPELRGISETATHIRFGALTTWTDLRRAALPPAFAGYQAAARDVGGLQVQNRGTLVGNICTASPAGDGIPCLLTLDAEVELASATGNRIVPMAEFVTGYRQTCCRPDEMITAILVPKPRAGAQGAFLKLGARRYLVISLVMVAGVVSAGGDGRIDHARIAVGACGPVAMRLVGLEAELIGCDLAEAAGVVRAEHLEPLSPIDDVRASASYRQAAAAEMVGELLAGLVGGQARRAA